MTKQQETDKFLVYVSEYGGFPKPGIIKSIPSLGGKYMNMYGLPSSRQYLIKTKEGDLMGICSKTNKLCTFDIIDDTYVVQIPGIMKLKEALDNIPDVPFDESLLTPKSRFYK